MGKLFLEKYATEINKRNLIHAKHSPHVIQKKINIISEKGYVTFQQKTLCKLVEVYVCSIFNAKFFTELKTIEFYFYLEEVSLQSVYEFKV